MNWRPHLQLLHGCITLLAHHLKREWERCCKAKKPVTVALWVLIKMSMLQTCILVKQPWSMTPMWIPIFSVTWMESWQTPTNTLSTLEGNWVISISTMPIDSWSTNFLLKEATPRGQRFVLHQHSCYMVCVHYLIPTLLFFASSYVPKWILARILHGSPFPV